MLKPLFLTCLLILAFFKNGISNVWLPDIFSDGMVLQRNAKIKIWGNAAPRERVVVTLRGRSAVTRADRQGNWEVYIQPLSAGGPFILNVLGKNLITINNVWIGDVWLLSGEPFNMETEQTQRIARESNLPYKAFFKLPEKPAFRAVENEKGEIRWSKSVADRFMMQMATTINSDVPVGFIINHFNEARLSAWINPDSLKNFDAYRDTISMLTSKYTAEEVFFSEASGRKAGDYPSVIYNGMVVPIKGYAVSGLVFQFSFLDAPYAYYTAQLYKLLLQSMRDSWANSALPVLFVNQLHPDKRINTLHFSELFEIQKELLAFDKVGILNHLEEQPLTINSFTKALSSLARQNIDLYRPALFKKHKKEGEKFIINFDTKAPLQFFNKYGYGKGFEIAGKDRCFYPAKAFIKTDTTIEVSSSLVNEPRSVRYGYQYLFEGNLTNQNSYTEALPFKTDYWFYTTDTSNYKTTWLPFENIATSAMIEGYYESLSMPITDSSVVDLPKTKLRQYRSREERVRVVKKILGLENSADKPLSIPVHVSAITEESGLVTENIIINTEGDVFLSASFTYNPEKVTQKVYIIDDAHNFLSDTLLAAGFALLEFTPRSLDGMDSIKRKEILSISLEKENPLLGRQVYDYQRILDYLQTKNYLIDTTNIHLAQLDTASSNRIDMMLTAAIDERVQTVFLQNHILELGTQIQDIAQLASVMNVPALFERANVTDLMALTVPRRLTIISPVDKGGNHLTQGKVNLLSRSLRYAYYRNNVSRNLQIKTGSNTSINVTAGYIELVKNSLMIHALE